MQGLTWSNGVSYDDARLREDFCFVAAPNCEFETFDGTFLDFQAEESDRLSLTAPWKGSSSLRYLALYVKNLFDTRGDPGGVTAIGGKIYTVYTRPLTVGVRVGRRF